MNWELEDNNSRFREISRFLSMESINTPKSREDFNKMQVEKNTNEPGLARSIWKNPNNHRIQNHAWSIDDRQLMITAIIRGSEERKQVYVMYVPGTGEVEELPGGGEDDEPDVGVAEDGELLGLLEQPLPPLGEGHLPRRQVVDPPYRYPLPLPHHRSSILPSTITYHCCNNGSIEGRRRPRQDESHMFIPRKRSRSR
jgi:hypothetical protein